MRVRVRVPPLVRQVADFELDVLVVVFAGARVHQLKRLGPVVDVIIIRLGLGFGFVARVVRACGVAAQRTGGSETNEAPGYFVRARNRHVGWEGLARQ